MTQSTWHYHELAAECYGLGCDEAPFCDQAFFHHCLSHNGGVALEIACGTGRLLVPFLRHGLAVEGVDASAEMLELCRPQATPSEAPAAGRVLGLPPRGRSSRRWGPYRI